MFLFKVIINIFMKRFEKTLTEMELERHGCGFLSFTKVFVRKDDTKGYGQQDVVMYPSRGKKKWIYTLAFKLNKLGLLE